LNVTAGCGSGNSTLAIFVKAGPTTITNSTISGVFMGVESQDSVTLKNNSIKGTYVIECLGNDATGCGNTIHGGCQGSGSNSCGGAPGTTACATLTSACR
jgi:hypothetical protein